MPAAMKVIKPNYTGAFAAVTQDVNMCLTLAPVFFVCLFVFYIYNMMKALTNNGL